MFVAGRRSGKTVVACIWLTGEVLNGGPEALGYYVAPYRWQAKAIAWDMLLKTTREVRVSKNESELSVTLFTGGKIALRGADDPETLEGVGLVAAVLDEFGRMKLAAWEKSLRPALSDHSGRALFCGKPRGFNHLRDFYMRGKAGEPTATRGWRSWLITTAEAGFVTPEDIEEAKRDLPPRIFRQEYLASFETLAGRVYDEFVRSRAGKPWHVVPHAEIEREFKTGDRWNFRNVVVGVDWGMVNPGVMLVLGITGTGRVVVVHEEVHREMLVSELGWLRVARSIRERFGPPHNMRFTADPSEPGNITALRSALGGYPIVQNANNDVAEGIRRVSIKLLPREDKRPGLLISDACHKTIKEIEGYVWREVSGAMVEEPVGTNDHCMDALRYGVMAATTFETERQR